MRELVRSWDGYIWLIERETDRDAIGRHEELPIRILQKLGKDFEGKNRLFIDVGANVGMYSVRMKDYYDKIIAIEPDPRNFITLKENISLNFEKQNEVNIFPLPIAAGDIDGEALLESKGVGSRIISKGKEGTNLPGLEKVKIVRLDTLLPSIFDLDNFDLITIKVDVEGFEENVVRGAEGILSNYPIVWLIEHHEFRGFKNLKSFKKIQAKLRYDYHIFNINEVHWMYASKKIDIKFLSWSAACHWFYKAMKNISSGKPWYYGIPGRWWHGKTILDFYETIKYEQNWFDLLKEG